MANLIGSTVTSWDACEGLSRLTYLKQEIPPLMWVAPFYSTCIWYLCFELLSCALAELPLDLRPSFSSFLLTYKSFGFSTWTAVSVNSEYEPFSSLQPEPLYVLLQSISQTRQQQKEGKRDRVQVSCCYAWERGQLGESGAPACILLCFFWMHGPWLPPTLATRASPL